MQGSNPDGSIIYRGNIIPVRDEKEQADYVETQIKLLSDSDANGVFVFVFCLSSYAVQ
jgi:hypothetical protein